MTNIETAVIAFTAFNAVRVVSYIPQIIKIWRDRHGCEAVSIITWMLFGLSHLSTVIYALIVVNDYYMAAVFSANAFCCAIIVVLTKRSRMLYAQTIRAVGKTT